MLPSFNPRARHRKNAFDVTWILLGLTSSFRLSHLSAAAAWALGVPIGPYRNHPRHVMMTAVGLARVFLAILGRVIVRLFPRAISLADGVRGTSSEKSWAT